MKTVAQMIAELEDDSRERYKNENPDTYDLRGAVSYWSSLSTAELIQEHAAIQPRS